MQIRLRDAEELLEYAEAMCHKFVQKCLDGRARSFETKSEMVRFLNDFNDYKKYWKGE